MCAPSWLEETPGSVRVVHLADWFVSLIWLAVQQDQQIWPAVSGHVLQQAPRPPKG